MRTKELLGGTDASRQAERSQRRVLARNRAIATGLLLVMVAVLLATRAFPEQAFWVALVRAGAEAAVVGGLADWFAVTALFHHPLGLPIPHTAVVPRNKDRIGRGLGSFVESNFLAPSIVARRLHAIDPAGQAARWLVAPGNAEAVAARLVRALPFLLRSLEDREIRAFVATAFGEQLRELDLAPALGRLIAVLTSSGEYDALFDRAVEAARRRIRLNAGRIEEMVGEHSQWWVPKAIDRRIAKILTEAVDDLLAELLHPGSEARQAFRKAIDTLTVDLAQSPEHRRRVEAAKNQILEHPEVQAWLASIWDEVRRIVLDDLATPRSRTRQAVVTALSSLGRALEGDEVMRRRFNTFVEKALLASIVPWRGEVGRLIADVVQGWDARTVSDRLELAMGGDLQYIRITGTLVGACVGILLFLLSRVPL